MREWITEAMKFILARLTEGEPEDVEEILNPQELDLEFPDWKYAKPLRLSGTVEKGQDSLAFRGHLVSSIEQECGRCLVQVPRQLDKPFDLFYEIKGKDEIDCTDDIREVLILEHPISFLCRESCRGLCPHCGINRNESRCSCRESGTKKSPFADLKQDLDRRKKEK